MRVDGKVIPLKCVRDGINAGIAYVPEDRKDVGLVIGQSILHNVSLPHLGHYRKYGFLRKKKEWREVEEICRKMSVKAAGLKYAVSTLSGGNQQKVVLSKWLLQDMKVLILDEPTRGIDVGAKAEIHRQMCELAAEGVAIIMISSELPEILGMSDRVYVMHEGTVTGELERKDATQEAIMKAAIGEGKK